MSDEIVNVNAQVVKDIPDQKLDSDGQNIPDSSLMENLTPEQLKEIEERRQEVSQLPEFPKEWQEEYKDEDTKGFDDELKIPITATIKEKEIGRLIKKYKRYMKSNFREIQRLGGENNEG